jgi:hypothetical protein
MFYFKVRIFKKLLDYHFHSSPRISHKNIIYNVTFWSIFINFHTLWRVLFGPNIFIMYKIFIFVEFLEKLIKSNSKLLKSLQSSQYYHQVRCTHLVNFLKCKKLYFVTTILGDFNVLSPMMLLNQWFGIFWARLKELQCNFWSKLQDWIPMSWSWWILQLWLFSQCYFPWQFWNTLCYGF